MKTIKYILFILIFISCGSNESEDIPIDFFDMIVQGSPWVLDRVEIHRIEGKDGYIFSQLEIDELAKLFKKDFYGTFTFYADGTGLWDSDGWCQNCTIRWEEIPDKREIRWSHRSYIHSYDIRYLNHTLEIVWNTKNEEGWVIMKPDGTSIRGDYLDTSYIWK